MCVLDRLSVMGADTDWHEKHRFLKTFLAYYAIIQHIVIYVYKDDGMFIRAARHINTNKMQQLKQANLIFLRVEKINKI